MEIMRTKSEMFQTAIGRWNREGGNVRDHLEFEFAAMPEPAEIFELRKRLAKANSRLGLKSMMRAELGKVPSIDECMLHRCSKHYGVPRHNSNEHSGAECGGCIIEALRSEAVRLEAARKDCQNADDYARQLRSEIARKDEAIRMAIGNLEEGRDLTAADELRLALSPAARKPPHDNATCPNAPRGKEFDWAEPYSPATSGSVTVTAEPKPPEKPESCVNAPKPDEVETERSPCFHRCVKCRGPLQVRNVVCGQCVADERSKIPTADSAPLDLGAKAEQAHRRSVSLEELLIHDANEEDARIVAEQREHFKAEIVAATLIKLADLIPSYFVTEVTWTDKRGDLRDAARAIEKAGKL